MAVQHPGLAIIVNKEGGIEGHLAIGRVGPVGKGLEGSHGGVGNQDLGGPPADEGASGTLVHLFLPGVECREKIILPVVIVALGRPRIGVPVGPEALGDFKDGLRPLPVDEIPRRENLDAGRPALLAVAVRGEAPVNVVGSRYRVREDAGIMDDQVVDMGCLRPQAKAGGKQNQWQGEDSHCAGVSWVMRSRVSSSGRPPRLPEPEQV